MNGFSSFLTTHIDLLLSVLVTAGVVYYDRRFHEESIFVFPGKLFSVLSLAAGFSFVSALILGLEAAGKPQELLAAYESVFRLIISENPGPLWILAFFIAVPAAEELLFRGLIQNSVLRRFGEIPSVLVSVISFALFGLFKDGMPGLLMNCFTGLLSALFFLMHESIWPCILLAIGARDAFTLPWLRYFVPAWGLSVLAVLSLIAAGILVFTAFRLSDPDAEEEEEEDGEDEENEDEENGEEESEKTDPPGRESAGQEESSAAEEETKTEEA